MIKKPFDFAAMTFAAVKLNDSNKCLKWQSVFFFFLFLNLCSYFSMYVVFVSAEVEKKIREKLHFNSAKK